MGYKRQRKIYRLRFEDPSMDGLEVDTTGANVEEFVTLAQLTDLSEFAVNASEITKENLAKVTGAAEKVADLFRAFAKHLVAWNLEDDDADGNTVPVPANYEGLRTQDPEFVLEIIEAWMTAVGGVSGPKGQKSSAGAPLAGVSRETEALLASLPVSPMPSSSSEPASDSAAFPAS